MLRNVESRHMLGVFDQFVPRQEMMDAPWIDQRAGNTQKTDIKAWNSSRSQARYNYSFHEGGEKLILADKALKTKLPETSAVQTPLVQYREEPSNELLNQGFQGQSQKINCFPQRELVSGNVDYGLNDGYFRQSFSRQPGEQDCRHQFNLQSPLQEYFGQIRSIAAGEQLQASYLDGKWGIDQGYGISDNIGHIKNNDIITTDQQLSGMNFIEIQNNQELSSQPIWQGCVTDDAGLLPHDCNMICYTGTMPMESQHYESQQDCEDFTGGKWPPQGNFTAKIPPDVVTPALTLIPSYSKSSQGNSTWPAFPNSSAVIDGPFEPVSDQSKIAGKNTSSRAQRLLSDIGPNSIQDEIVPIDGFELNQLHHRNLRQTSYNYNTESIPHSVNSVPDNCVSLYSIETTSHTSSPPPQVSPMYEGFRSNELKSCATSRRNARDEFLIQKKQAGMSYKDIKREGGYTEAESTLRGRFRTLTKAKSARVRKPEWTDNDIRLLRQAVNKLTPKANRSKVPWKKVAEFIVENGGSYHFGNSTCRKRWDELHDGTKAPGFVSE